MGAGRCVGAQAPASWPPGLPRGVWLASLSPLSGYTHIWPYTSATPTEITILFFEYPQCVDLGEYAKYTVYFLIFSSDILTGRITGNNYIY